MPTDTQPIPDDGGIGPRAKRCCGVWICLGNVNRDGHWWPSQFTISASRSDRNRLFELNTEPPPSSSGHDCNYIWGTFQCHRHILIHSLRLWIVWNIDWIQMYRLIQRNFTILDLDFAMYLCLWKVTYRRPSRSVNSLISWARNIFDDQLV